MMFVPDEREEFRHWSREYAARMELTKQLASDGWMLQSLCNLPVSYCRPSTVTPYFFCSDIRTGFNCERYVMEGAVGVIHQEFEKVWSQQKTKNPRDRTPFCTAVHVENVRALHDTRMLRSRKLTLDLGKFSQALIHLLARIPSDEHSLVEAFRLGSMAGIPINRFGFNSQAKFRTFCEWVKARPSQTQPQADAMG